MEIGDIYLLKINIESINYSTESLNKIIMFDSNEVFTEELNKEGALVYAKNKTKFYSRTERTWFENNSQFIKCSNFTENEILINRPDLPLRLNCFKDIFWTDKQFESIDIFIKFLNSYGISENNLNNLPTSKVIIYPSSQQQSLKKPILLESESDVFSGVEFMYKCFQIQREYIKSEKPYFSSFRLLSVGREEKRLSGIGVYRLGIKGNIPSFYLGGFISDMEFDSDDSFIV